MLCDLMIGEWCNPADAPKTEPDLDEIIAANKRGEPWDRAKVKPFLPRIIKHEHALRAWLESERPHLDVQRNGIRYEELGAFQEKLKAAHKFHLSRAFAEASLDSLATPETVIKAKEWFKLIHDPMWMEWELGIGGLRTGALFYSLPAKHSDSALMCYALNGITGHSGLPNWKTFEIRHLRIFPESIRLDGDRFRIDMDDASGVPVGADEFNAKVAMWAYDYVIRLNSPRITEFQPCEGDYILDKHNTAGSMG